MKVVGVQLAQGCSVAFGGGVGAGVTLALMVLAVVSAVVLCG